MIEFAIVPAALVAFFAYRFGRSRALDHALESINRQRDIQMRYVHSGTANLLISCIARDIASKGGDEHARWQELAAVTAEHKRANNESVD